MTIFRTRCKNKLTKLSFCLSTGTGSDVKVPKKPDRLKSSPSINGISHGYRPSAGKQRESGAENRNALSLGHSSISPSSGNSQGKSSMPTDSRSTNQNAKNIEMSNSPNTLLVRDGNDSGLVERANKSPTSTSCHQHRDKDRGKHREKRKHCDSTGTDKHRHKKRKHSRDARFEGHRISHLVKKRTFNKQENEETSTEDQKKCDDYVLAKLFRKSGRLNAHLWYLTGILCLAGLFILLGLPQVSTV